jgi:hypothetical protein
MGPPGFGYFRRDQRPGATVLSGQVRLRVAFAETGEFRGEVLTVHNVAPLTA